MNKIILLILLFASCHHAHDDMKPKLSYSVQDRYLKQLPSPFPPLSPVEKTQDWSKEYTIGLGFAHELDLYQAMTAFKRSEYLAPPLARKMEIEYDIFLCYYLGQKYADAVYTFEQGDLKTASSTFPAHQDLLILLYDSYLQLDEEEKADSILNYMQQLYPDTAQKLSLSGLLIQGNLPALSQADSSPVQNLLAQYQHAKKSVGTAKGLNAVLPGSGYLYLGQTQSAMTAFFLNGLFIWAAVHFFQHHNLAAGIITTSFEAGWYFGGIYGVGQEANFYNVRLYEHLATPMMNENKLFPVLMLKYAF
jgi:hypothetical protein